METAYSVNQVPIRLTDKRWSHIVEAHDDMAGYHYDCLATIERPDFVLRGNRGSLHAIRHYGRRGYLVVVYREVNAEDGFVITAFFTRKLHRRKIIWRPQ